MRDRDLTSRLLAEGVVASYIREITRAAVRQDGVAELERSAWKRPLGLERQLRVVAEPANQVHVAAAA